MLLVPYAPGMHAMHPWDRLIHSFTGHAPCCSIHPQDKRPSYDEWSAEFKRVKKEQERKQITELLEEEELARACCREGREGWLGPVLAAYAVLIIGDAKGNMCMSSMNGLPFTPF